MINFKNENLISHSQIGMDPMIPILILVFIL